jgi:peptidoglycan/xylan/chitin deacetylase (PgdA/CDA1 family)
MPSLTLFPLLADLAFWGGVRAIASSAEWNRWTRSSYVVLLYHRVAGEQIAGEERLDVAPARFEAQLRLLRRLRFRPLRSDELLAFHREQVSTLSRRRYVLTFDDAYRDAVRALAGKGDHLPEMFVPTDWVGRAPPWGGRDDVILADWDQLRALAKDGIALGSHTKSHPVLPELPPSELDDELRGSRRILEENLGEALPFLAYPHGRYDDAVRTAAASAGYAVAYTTDPGRNGAGTDPLALRRISVKDWDSRLSFIWKALTGEQLPAAWERRRQRRHRHRELGGTH